jgi:hypothetical protein
MSVEATALSPAHGLLANARNRRVLRYAVGATLAMALAMGVAWDLSFLTAVLSLTFLAAPGPPPSFRKGVGFLAVIAVSCIAGLWISKYLLGFPLIFFPAFGLLLLWLFYAKTGSAAPFLIMWLLIALLVVPMLAVQSPALARFVVAGIIVGAAATLLVVWVAHLLIPEPPTAVATVTAAKAKTADTAAATPPTPAERFQTAWTITLVVMPVFVVFHIFEWVGGILILIFVALLSMQPGFAKDFKAGGALILGNVMGGIAAIAMFELLTIVPEYVFMLLLTLLTGLFFGSRLMSESPKAPLYGMAFSTLLLVIGSTTTSTTGDATTKVYSRILQMMVAVIYVVTAFGLIERYRRARDG